MDKHFFLLTDLFFIHRDVLEIYRLDKIARRSKRVGGAIADLWAPKKSPLFRMVKKCCCRSDFFTECEVPEINRLDKNCQKI